MKLTKCIYGFETNPKNTPFGLLNNQVRVDNIIQNAGWFNENGEKLGTGDLNLKEMNHIAANIKKPSVFFVLNEMDSSYDIPSHLDRSEPGTQYVMDKAAWVIVPAANSSGIIRVRDDAKSPEDVEKDGIKFVRMSRASLRKLFVPVASSPVVAQDKETDKKPEKDDDFKDLVARMSKAIANTKMSSPASPPAKSVFKPIPVAKPSLSTKPLTKAATKPIKTTIGP